MDIFNLRNAENVFKNFLNFPEQLEVIIENKRLGLHTPGYEKWYEYDIADLEKGMVLIKKKIKSDFYKNAGEIALVVVFVGIEMYLVLSGLKRSSPEIASIVIKNIQLIAITSIPALFIWETIEVNLDIKEERPAHIKVLRRGVKIMILIILLLDLINLFVGA